MEESKQKQVKSKLKIKRNLKTKKTNSIKKDNTSNDAIPDTQQNIQLDTRHSISTCANSNSSDIISNFNELHCTIPIHETKTKKIHSELKNTNKIEDKVDILCDLMLITFVDIKEKMNILETKIEDIQKTIKDNSNQNGTLLNLNTNSLQFKRVENKEDYLNENIKNVIQQDIVSFIKQECLNHITEQTINELLYKKYDIYTFASNVIFDIQIKNDVKFIYSFAFQKNSSTIYFWNHENQKWEKMDQSIMHKLFDAVQKCVALKFNEYILSLQDNADFESKSSDFIEHGVNIFVDDYDKKHKRFKKLIFEKLSS